MIDIVNLILFWKIGVCRRGMWWSIGTATVNWFSRSLIIERFDFFLLLLIYLCVILDQILWTITIVLAYCDSNNIYVFGFIVPIRVTKKHIISCNNYLVMNAMIFSFNLWLAFTSKDRNSICVESNTRF